MYRSNLLLITLAIALYSFSFHPAESDEQWLTNFELAQTMATKKKKPILMVFSGSDWCKPCIILDETILSTEKFSEYARDRVVLLKVDFPAFRKNKLSREHQKRNDALAEKYNQEGYFPNVMLIDAEGSILKQIRYTKGMEVQSFIDQINDFTSVNE